MTSQKQMQEILQQEAKAVLNIPINDQYEKAVSLIVDQVHEKKGKLVTSGMGKAGQIAMKHRHNLLFDRHSGRIFTPQRSPTRRLGHIAGKRRHAGHLQLG